MSRVRLDVVIEEARACQQCAELLPHPPRPVLRATARARVLIVGQAPGAKVHASGIDWQDASGDRLRAWMGVTREVFYGPRVAIVPMGFCFPGKGRSGDLPPRPECAPLWHPRLLPLLREVRLTLVVGAYAQARIFNTRDESVTDAVRAFERRLPTYLPLPHPSPRNALWETRNPWFAERCLPLLKERVDAALAP